jgi:hypothetical protein
LARERNSDEIATLLIGLGDERRLAREVVAHQGDLVSRRNQKGVEAIELPEAGFDGTRERVPTSSPPLQEAARGFAIVVGFNVNALDFEPSPNHVVVGQRPVMHQAEVLTGRERMSVHRGDA